MSITGNLGLIRALHFPRARLPISVALVEFRNIVTSMIVLGYVLGTVPVVRHNFEKFVLAIIAVSLAPAILQVLKSRKTPAAVKPN